MYHHFDDDEQLRAVGIIPARYASSRFPGKPLAMIGGKLMIERVWERAKQALDTVVVATDDNRIAAAVEAFGGNVVMTSTHHRSGTDRCREALDKLGKDVDVVVNIQGDEPFIDPEQIRQLCHLFADDPITDIATLIRPVPYTATYAELSDPNTVKVVTDSNGYALYFSRFPIPFMRNEEPDQWAGYHDYYTHIGMYAYRSFILRMITELEPSPLERAENLEQLRWLENGLRIRTAVSELPTIGIDTPADLERAEQYLKTLEQ